MRVYGASIDSVSVSGYGAGDTRIERPRGVPDDWELVSETVSFVSDDYDEVAARVSALEDRATAAGYYPHGWSIQENPDGTFGPGELTYWAPPGEAKDSGKTLGIVIGAAGVALTVLALGIGIMESQKQGIS
jgi:hypothetical protein